MEIKNSISNLTYAKDVQYLKNNTNTCKCKLILFKYGLPKDGLWLPEDIKNVIIDKHIFLEVQLQKFLRLVAEGEQDQAEAMLKENPDLGLLAGEVTDLSKRSFNNITGFQYAVWALDYHMWTMLLKYLKPEEITKQLQDMETGSWVKAYGKSVSWQNLIDALDTYISFYHQYKWDEAESQWNKSVGNAQAMLPVHVVNVYCHSNRSSSSGPNFKDTIPIPRLRQTNEGDWFTSKYNGDVLGTGRFAFVSTSAGVPWGGRGGDVWVWGYGYCMSDKLVLDTLLRNRVKQQQALFAAYLDNQSQTQFNLK